jgi:hypothetical protein
MARKRSSKRRVRRSTAISLTGLAESYILGSAATKALTGNNLMEFVSGRRGGNLRPGADGGQNISLPELLGFRTVHGKTVFTGDFFGQGHFGTSENRFNYTSAIKHNLGAHGLQSAATMIMTPIAFRFGKKLARKPISMANKLLKGSGVRV